MPKPIFPGIDKQKLTDLEGKLDIQIRNAYNSPNRKKMEEMIIDSRKRCYSKTSDLVARPFDGASEVNLPISLSNVQSYTARFVNAILGASPKVELIGDFPQDVLQSLEKKFSALFETRPSLTGLIDKYVHTYFQDGLVGVRVLNEKRLKSIKEVKTWAEWMDEDDDEVFKRIKEQYTDTEIEEFNDNPEIQVSLIVNREREEAVSDYMTLDELIFPEDMEILKQSEAEFIGRAKYVTKDELDRLVKVGEYDKEAVERVKNENKEVGYQKEDILIEEDMFQLDASQVGTVDDSQNKVKIHEIYFKYSVSDSGHDQIWVAEQEFKSRAIVKVRLFEDVEYPIKLSSFHTDNKYVLSSKGIVYMLSSLHDAINVEYNTKVNESTLASSLIGVYREGSGFDPDEYTLGPWSMVGVQNVAGDLKFERPPGVSSGSQFMEQLTTLYVQSVTGLNDIGAAGASNLAKHRTSGGISQILAQGLVVVEYRLRLLIPRLNEFFTLLFKHLLNKDAIRVKVRANILNIEKSMMRDVHEKMLAVLLAIPAIAQNPESVRILTKAFYESHDLTGFDRILPPQQQGPAQPGVPGQGPDQGMLNSPDTALANRGGAPVQQPEGIAIPISQQ